MDPYRAPTLPEPIAAPPRELLYEANERDRNRGVLIAWAQIFSAPMILGIVLASFVNELLGLVGFVGGIVFAVWYRKHSATRGGAVLRIDDGRLLVLSPDLRSEKACFKLRDLDAVELDVKTIRRVQDGDSPIAVVKFTQTTVGPEVDTARIVLVGRGRSYRMTEAYLAHMDATEWLGKIRVFLRKNGWVPATERKKKKRAAREAADQPL